MQKLVLLLLSGLLVLLTGLFFGIEENRVTVFDKYGFVIKGQKFNVSVGQPSEEAIELLRAAHWKFFESKLGGYCLKRKYSADTEVFAFYDDTWRKIALCIGVKEARVVSIEWNATPMMSEL